LEDVMSVKKAQQPSQARRSFSDEFKRDAVKLVVADGYSFKAAADAVGVSSRSLREWHEKFAPKPEPCGEDASTQQLQEENRRLRKELKRAEVEREILKKATAYFARESQ
jgi:transposase